MKIQFEYKHPYSEIKKVTDNNGVEWVLNGKCILCGKCCLKMKNRDICNLLSEPVLHNGKKERPCLNYWDRYFNCVMYPIDPHYPLLEGCGYSWERK